MDKKAYRIGIDFGTCYSFPAFLSDNYDLIPLTKNTIRGIPSVYYHDSDTGDLFGEDAEELGDYYPDGMVSSVKQKLDWKVFELKDNIKITPKDVVTRILKHIIDYANQILCEDYEATSISEVVIAVPVEFGNDERLLIKEAAQASADKGGAGVLVIDLIEDRKSVV